MLLSLLQQQRNSPATDQDICVGAIDENYKPWMPDRDFNCYLSNLIKVKVRYTLLQIDLISKITDNNDFENILLGIKLWTLFEGLRLTQSFGSFYKTCGKLEARQKTS